MVDSVEYQYIDGEEKINFNQDISFKQCILNHLAKISSICSKEIAEGYWERRPVSVGSTTEFIEKWHEDTREAYCNSIKYLYILLEPFFTQEKIEITFNLANNMDIKDKLEQADKTFLEISRLLNTKNYLEGGVIRDVGRRTSK